MVMGSYKGGGNQYIQLVKVMHCTPKAKGKQLPMLSHMRLGPGFEL